MAACGFWQQCASAGSISASQVQDLGFSPELKIRWSFTSNGKDVFLGGTKTQWVQSFVLKPPTVLSWSKISHGCMHHCVKWQFYFIVICLSFAAGIHLREHFIIPFFLF